jgi:hypothetical protein
LLGGALVPAGGGEPGGEAGVGHGLAPWRVQRDGVWGDDTGGLLDAVDGSGRISYIREDSFVLLTGRADGAGPGRGCRAAEGRGAERRWRRRPGWSWPGRGRT